MSFGVRSYKYKYRTIQIPPVAENILNVLISTRLKFYLSKNWPNRIFWRAFRPSILDLNIGVWAQHWIWTLKFWLNIEKYVNFDSIQSISPPCYPLQSPFHRTLWKAKLRISKLKAWSKWRKPSKEAARNLMSN